MTCRVWRDSLLFPAYLATLSAVSLIIKGALGLKWVRSLVSRVSCSRKQTEEEIDEANAYEVVEHGGILADIKAHVNAKGGPVIFAYKTLRLIGCLLLVALTIATLVMDENDRQTGFLEVLKKKKRKKKNKNNRN